MKTLALILRADPRLSAIGNDDPSRPGFSNSRAWLERDEAGFEAAYKWLMTHPLRTSSAYALSSVISRASHRRTSPGAVLAAARALGLPLGCPRDALQRSLYVQAI